MSLPSHYSPTSPTASSYGDNWPRRHPRGPWLDPEYGTPGYAEFLVDFEMDDTDYLVDGDFYKGTDFWRIITRRTDGRQFRFMYWDSPGNDSLEAESNPNGADFGLDEGDYVFRPVAPATIPTFSFEVA